MSTGLTASPRLVRGGIATVDPTTGRVLRVIALQYNPDSLTRSFQIQPPPARARTAPRPLRLKGPPVETITVEAELDAADQLEFPGAASPPPPRSAFTRSSPSSSSSCRRRSPSSPETDSAGEPRGRSRSSRPRRR